MLVTGIDYEHREVVLRVKPAEMLAASPKGTVPVLVLQSEDGTVKVIDQSLDIMLWALQQNDPYNWLEHEEDALKWIAQCDGDFKFHLDRYKYPTRYEGATPTEAADHRAEAAVFANAVNGYLQKIPQNHYKFNSSLGIYYAGYMPFLRQFAHIDKAWFAAQAWPHLQTALAAFEASAEFKTIMQPHPQWQRV